MNLNTYILRALLAVVTYCLINIVILNRHVKRLKSMLKHQTSINDDLNSWQISQEAKLDKIKLKTRHINNKVDNIASLASKENDAMDDVTTLLSGMKANCFSKKVGTDKKFAKSLHRINERVQRIKSKN